MKQIKTPEQLAEEYASKIYRLKYYVDGRLKPSQGQEGLRWLAGKNGFLAGYQAAKDNQEYLMNEMSILRSRLDTAEKLSQLVDEEKEQ